jgi:CubicO group peptidase (beta-lactamase class C family)
MRLTIILAVAALGAASPAGAASPLDAIFAKFTASTPGCAVGVQRGVETPILAAYGAANLEQPAANRVDTVFEAGSVSKQFTAAAILLLVQDGKIELDDDIRKYLPEMPDYGTPITIEAALNHTSGLRDWGAVEAIAGWPRGDRVYTLADVLHVSSLQRSLNYAPGSAWSYTNTGYNLSAMIVERVSGQSLAAFTRDRLFVPLGMNHTQWRDDFRRIVPGRATAYSPGDKGYAQDMPFESAYGNGGLLTTVGDLLTWNRALGDGKLGAFVTAELQRQAKLSDGRTVAYARGLFVQTWRGLPEVSHGGATAGYRAWLGRFPEHKLSVALLCNAGDAGSGSLAHQVADLYLPPAPPPPAAPAGPPPADLASHAGWYADERFATPLRLVMADGRLKDAAGPMVEPAAGGGLSLGGGRLAFLADGRLQLGSGGDAVTFARKADWSPDAAALAKVAGRYRSAEAEVVYAVRIDNGALRLTVEGRPGQTGVLTAVYADAFAYDGGVARLVRGAGGEVVALRLSSPRVWDLRLDRIG